MLQLYPQQGEYQGEGKGFFPNRTAEKEERWVKIQTSPEMELSPNFASCSFSQT